MLDFALHKIQKQNEGLMKSPWMRFSTVAAAIITSQASAAGFGEIRLHSHIGERLRAEVPVYLSSAETVDSACFSLAPLNGADLPVETGARLKLIRHDNGHRLMIMGNRPIDDPLFMIGLRAQCGIDLQRDYVLMPEAPPSQSDAPTESAPARPDARPPRGPRSRNADAMNTDGPEPAVSNPAPRPSRPKPPADQPPRKAKPAPPAVAKTTDRLMLSAPPSEPPANKKQHAQWGTLGEMDERMHKLESTLQSLSQEVDKLNTALALTTEALAAQQKLQEAQRQLAAKPSSTAGLAMAAPASPTPEPASRNNWLELLFGALLGGAVAGGVASYLGRRKERSIHDELPLAVSSYRPPPEAPTPVTPVTPATPATPVTPVISVTTPVNATPAAPIPSPTPSAANPAPAKTVMAVATVDIPLDTTAPSPDMIAADVVIDDTQSALDLAEIMLSFGRVRGAAETLAEHIEEASPANVQPWLLLLDLYRRGNMRPEFDALSARIRRRFNACVPAWEQSPRPVSGLKSLADYAHIIGRLPQIWGSQSCLDYLYGLVNVSRNGQRTGFPVEVVEEIALLIRVLEHGHGLKRTV